MAQGGVICIAGPTASGKTNLAARLAGALGGEVVSCDSMQLYRGMAIATAKPTEAEMLGVPHHMIDVVSPEEDYSAARYVVEAGRCVDDILARGKVPVIAGGTGLYMDSLVRGIDFADSPEKGIRIRLEDLYEQYGGQRLHRLLEKADRAAADKIHPNDKKRLVRALEVCFSSNEKISEHNNRTLALDERYKALYIGLNYRAREALYRRINERCDAMLAAGLMEELSALEGQMGNTAVQAIGYKELMGGNGPPSEEAIESWKRATRRYAKRQLTWFRRNPDMHWFYRDEQSDEEIFNEVLKSALLFLHRDVI